MTYNREDIKALLRANGIDPDRRTAGDWRREPTSTRHYTTVRGPLQRDRLAAVAQPTAEDWETAEYRTPSRPASVHSDVMVPFLQAIATGGFVAALLLIGVVLVGWPWRVPAIAFTVVSAGSWAVLLFSSRRLLWAIEKLTRRDFNGDGDVGRPEPETVRLEMHLEEHGRRHMMFADLPVNRELFGLWARGATGGRSLAEGSWIGSSGPFSKSQYAALLDEMERLRVVEWVNPNAHAQGRQLTTMGRHALEAWLSQ